MPAPDYSSLNNVIYSQGDTSSDAMIVYGNTAIYEYGKGEQSGWIRSKRLILGYRPLGARTNMNSSNPTLNLSETLDIRNFDTAGQQNFGQFVAPTYIAFDRWGGYNESWYHPEDWSNTPAATGGKSHGSLFGYIVYVQVITPLLTTQDQVKGLVNTPGTEPEWTGLGSESPGIPYYKFHAFVNPDGTVLGEDELIPEYRGKFRIGAESVEKQNNSYTDGGPWKGVEKLQDAGKTGGLQYYVNEDFNIKPVDNSPTPKSYKNTWIRLNNFYPSKAPNNTPGITFNFLQPPTSVLYDASTNPTGVSIANPWDGLAVGATPYWGGPKEFGGTANSTIEVSIGEQWWWRIFINNTGFKGVYQILNKLDVDNGKFKLMQKTSATSDYQDIAFDDGSVTLTLDNVKDKIMSLNSGFGSKGIRITPAAWNLLCTTIYNGYKGNTN